MLNSLLWAVIGAVLYKILATIFQIGHAGLLAKNIISHCLRLLGEVASDVAFIKQLKHKVAQEALSEEQANYIKELDDQMFEDWKERSILKFHQSFSGNTSSLIKFANWKEAMQYLDQEIKSDNAKK